MKILRSIFIVFAFLGMTLISTGAHANTILGDVNGIYIKDGLYTLVGWACVEGASVHPSISFQANIFTLGTTVVSETSEPAVSAVCSNSLTDLRFSFSIPSSYYWLIADHPITITASHPSFGSAELPNSGEFRVPMSYVQHPMYRMNNAEVIMWVGAHADDEIHAGVILSQLCHASTISCVFTVATGGDHPDRGPEMEDSGEFFQAFVYHETLADGAEPTPAQVIAGWENELGYAPYLEMAAIIDHFEPDYIVTMDPRHGNFGCHPDHMAITEVLMDAVTYLSFPTTDVYFATQQMRINSPAGGHHEALNTNLSPYNWNHWAYAGDSSAQHPTNGSINTAWDHVVELLDIHDSQFTSYERSIIRPLHWDGFDWLGNDSSGRLQTFQSMSTYSPTEEPFASICSF